MKRIAIAGYGVEGRANYQYFAAKYPDSELVIVDERDVVPDMPEGIEAILGEGAFGRLGGFDMVVRTAGLSPRKITTDGKVWSATNEFFARCAEKDVPIIGVTGTKGKGTTSSLIASILRAAGKTVHLVGNIGTPAIEVLANITPSDIVVYELSSFQLWDLQKSPHIAVVLPIEPDHLDVHVSFDKYLAAKANIRKHQGQDEGCYYHPTNEFAHQVAMTGDWPVDQDEVQIWQSQAFRYATDEAVYVLNGNFMVHGTVICPTSAVQLPGEFNIENACAAISAARNFTVDDDAIEAGLKAFTGLPHRLRLIREVAGVRYYDDNYSSAPSSTLAATRAFEVPEILIAGGYDRGVDLSDLAAALSQQANLKHVVLIGQTGPWLRNLLKENGYRNVTLLEDKPSMRAIVEAAAQNAVSGDVIIMSPACASFDMFKNFTDRGDQFVDAVEAL